MASKNPEVSDYCAEFTRIASDLKGLEGAAFDGNGDLYVAATSEEESGKPCGEILKIDLLTCEVSVYCKPKHGKDSGQPSGLLVDNNGTMWLADMKLGLMKVLQNGKSKQVANRDFGWSPIQGCKDICCDNEGHLWISAPGGQIAPNYKALTIKQMATSQQGAIYCYVPEEDRLVKVATSLKLPSGITVQHDKFGKPRNLLVAECGARAVVSYNISGPCDLQDKENWAKVIGQHVSGHGPTGMAVDKSGNVLVCNNGSAYIEVYSRFGGKMLKRIQCPSNYISSLAFRPGTKEVYITDPHEGAVWKFDWENFGML